MSNGSRGGGYMLYKPRALVAPALVLSGYDKMLKDFFIHSYSRVLTRGARIFLSELV